MFFYHNKHKVASESKLDEWFEISLYKEEPTTARFKFGDRLCACVQMYSVGDTTPYMHKLKCHFTLLMKESVPLGFYSCDTVELTTEFTAR